MPHKHTRRLGQRSEQDFDLPPMKRAAPLPTRPASKTFADKQQKQQQQKQKQKQKQRSSADKSNGPIRSQDGDSGATQPGTKKRKRDAGASDRGSSKTAKNKSDDTPAEFRRLMLKSAHLSARQKGLPPPSSSANTTSTSTSFSNKPAKQSRAPHPSSTADEPDVTATTTSTTPAKTLRGNTDPSLSTRSAPSKHIIPVLQNRASKLQRKIEKKVSAWHKTDARLRESESAARFARAEEHEERVTALLEKSGVKVRDVWDDDAMLGLLGLKVQEERADARHTGGGGGRGVGAEGGDGAVEETMVGGAGRKKKQQKQRRGRKGKDGEDDWAVLREKREKPKGLHDVVQAPPQLRKVREILGKKNKTTETAGGVVVDGGVGSAEGLKHKADLTEARMEVIRRYREMMGRSGASGGL